MDESIRRVIDELDALREGRPTDRSDAWKTFDPADPPLYCCLTGMTFEHEPLLLLPGLTLRSIFVDMFDAPMMAFKPPPNIHAAHPGPWASLRGGFTFKSRLEVVIGRECIPDGFTASTAAWLVAAVLRLQVSVPLRLAAVGNMPFMEMGSRSREAAALAFEAAPTQFGVFKADEAVCSLEDLAWLRGGFHTAAKLYHDPRFFRALGLFDEAQWCRTKELSTILIWSSTEALFDLGAEQNKTRAISKALSEYVGASSADRDRAYGVIRDLYQKRGSVVHVGRGLSDQDYVQSMQLARVAFRRAVIDGVLPAPPARSIH